MISSFFGKTKPINYIIVLAFLFIFYWIVRILWLEVEFVPQVILGNIGVLSILFFSFFVVNFIVKRNKLTKTNSFTILFYGLLCILFPESLMDNNGIFCSFFLLLATRKLLSLKSLKDIKYKLFDAALWVVIASLFYDWALLYMVWIFVAIYIYEPKNIRNWLVPIAAFVGIFLITLSVLVLSDKTGFLLNHYSFTLKFNKEIFLEWSKSSKLVVYLIAIIFIGFWSGIKIGKSGVGRIASIRLIALSFAIGIVLTLLEAAKGSFPIMVTFFPAAVFLTNYIETIRKSRFQEIALILSIVVPFSIFIFEVLLN